MRKIFLLLGIVLFAFTSCKKEVKEKEEVKVSSAGVIILNEGNFGWGNADFGFYDPETKEYTENVFEKVNNRPLGDVLQSGIIVEDDIYLVVNNSGNIEVIDKENFKHKSTISDLGSPRYLSIIKGTNDAYLTDTYSNKVSRINLKTGNISAQIPVYGWQDRVVPVGEKHYAVQSLLSKKVYLISSENNEIADSLEFSGDMGKLQSFNNKAYLLDRSEKSIIWEINENGDVQSFLENNSEISQFEMTDDGCYYIANGELYLFDGDSKIKIAEFPSSGRYYAMGFDKNSDLIFISDAKDYARKGKVFIIEKTGGKYKEIDAGVIPNGFLMK